MEAGDDDRLLAVLTEKAAAVVVHRPAGPAEVRPGTTEVADLRDRLDALLCDEADDLTTATARRDELAGELAALPTAGAAGAAYAGGDAAPVRLDVGGITVLRRPALATVPDPSEGPGRFPHPEPHRPSPMLDSLLSAGSMPLLERQAAWGEVRHTALASNLANIDTPDFRPVDLDPAAFRAALRKSVEARNPSPYASRNDAPADPLAGGVPDELLTPTARPGGGLTFHDGSPRSVEREVLTLTRNAMQRQAAVQLMTAQFAMLQAAITERA